MSGPIPVGRRGAVAATTAPSSLREKRQASGGVRYSSGPDFHNCCSTALLNERLPLLADSLKKSKILPRQNSRKSLSVADSFWGCVLHVAERICSSRRGPPCLTALNASAALKNLVPTAARTSIEPAPLGPFAMSASLIGRLRSSTFRLSATAVSMSLTGSRFSSESAPGPLYGASFVKKFGSATHVFLRQFLCSI